MIELRLAEIAAMLGAELHDGAHPDAVVRETVIDSRQAHSGALFVALPGERSDGHDHAAAAVTGGAVAVLAARPLGVPALVVEDPLLSLGRLARGVLHRLPSADVIGLTGSSGKTTTKDLLAHVLAAAGPTVAPSGSYNNEIGVPLTVLSADAATRHLVIEMGARGAGHIAYLCRVAPPRVGLVLNVGAAHVGEFGTLAATAAAKRELVESLPPAARAGVAILNADDDLVAAMASATSANVVTFGRSTDADVRAERVDLDALARPGFDLVTAQGRAHVQLRLSGEHQVANALAAAAVAITVGLDVAATAAALQTAEPRSRWRMEVSERADGVTVINDAYNANPASMRAALQALAAIGGGTRRTWAVLGEMLELGAASADEHAAIGRLAVQLAVSRLVVVGEGAEPIHAAASRSRGRSGEETAFVADVDDALARVRQEVLPGDVVLVKASRRAGLERIASELLAGTG